jgi:NAD(P)-dependent dehydrogenase (short-subunit alcohol dehydrogenase family)
MTRHEGQTMTSIKDKRVLVTGAGRGLGATIAHGFAGQGATVIVADIDAALAAGTAQAIRDAGGHAVDARLDVTDAGAVRAFAAHCAARHGNLDILINNAGISARAPFDDPQTPAIWDRVMQVNLQGTFNVTHAFVEQLKATRGAIVNLCSIVAYGCGISTAGYVVSKGGVRSFTEVLARDLGPHGVRVNAVAPGLMETDMTAGQRAQANGTDWYMGRAPLARAGRADEIVGPVLFLASDMASYVNGVVLPVDGGYLAV